MAESPATTERTGGVPRWLRPILVLGFLYLFLVGVKGLETGIKVFGVDAAERIFGYVSSPVAGLFAGILATVLVQSSSVTTSTIVGLVGSGSLSVAAAVPMIMGANIGTTVTNTLASLGHVRRGAEFKRAFAGATVHDFFNVFAVVVFLPLELATGFLSKSATAVSSLLAGSGSVAAAPGKSPIKAAIKAPVALIEGSLTDLGLHRGWVGSLILALALVSIFVALVFVTRNMRVLMAGRMEAGFNAVLGRGAGLGAMILGVVVTVAVQSSSITTSILVPLLGAGVITLENAYPVTLGANLGTTVTALLASLAADRPEALTIALTHTLFNVFGILAFYPVPLVRRLPLRAARALAEVATRRKRVVLAYLVAVFVVLPLVGIVVFR